MRPTTILITIAVLIFSIAACLLIDAITAPPYGTRTITHYLQLWRR